LRFRKLYVYILLAMKTQNVYGLVQAVRIDSTIKKALKEIARKKDLTLGQVIREALREKIEKEK
jgi:predicted DNA-binding ribbon-helix-helix protein